MQVARTVLSFVLIPLFIAACSRDKPGAGRDEIATDTALARDLREATDTSAYGASADVAIAEFPDSIPKPASPPVRMRVEPSPSRAVPSDARAKPTPASAKRDGVTESSCDSPATDDQRRCLMSYLAKSDVGLDRTYQSLIAEMKHANAVRAGEREPEPVTRLRVAQRAWLVYRDAECRQCNRGKEGPLWAPVRARCLAEFSGRRQEELATTLAGLAR